MIDKIIAYESGELDNVGIIELFAELIKSGQAWTLQGHYGRVANSLIENKILDNAGVINWEKYQGLSCQ